MYMSIVPGDLVPLYLSEKIILKTADTPEFYG